MSNIRQVPAYQLIDGSRRWPYLDPAIAHEASKYEPQDDDVLLVTYPSSGTHWTKQIIALILHRGETALNYVEFVTRGLSLEVCGSANVSKQPKPRLILSHFQLLRNNFNAKAKYVYVARNPWDCCVSYFNMCRTIPFFKFEEGSLDDFLDAFLTGGLGNGDYFEHVRDAYARRNEPNVFFLTYEDLKADTPGMILKLAYFLGDEYGKALEQDEDLLRKVLERSSLEFMGRVLEPKASDLQTIVANFKDVNFTPCELSFKDRPNKFKTFRKGQVNTWKEYFTTEQAQRVQARLQDIAPELCTLWDLV
ncbi:amine sulfotransferase-like [Ixodes scapularis]